MFEQDTSEANEKKRVRTLLVDDCLIMGRKLGELLTTMPHIEKIGFATNGKEAVEIAQTLRPELVVMDIQMPVMNGIEAARALRILLPETRVVLTSAVGPAGTLHAPGIGAVEFVPKSRLWEELPAVIEKLLGNKFEN